MKYLDVRFRQPDWMLHPMQEFIREEDVVEYEELLTWNLLPEEAVEYELFYVEADRERYVPAVESVESIVEYTLTPIDDDSFYVYACQQTREEDRRFRQAFANLHLLVVPPIVYDSEAALHMTVVGAGEDLQMLVEGVPEEIDVTVEEIGEYDRRHGTIGAALTDRQFEAVRAAAEVGYYEVPRSGSLADVVARLDCAESTASTLLRRAESAVMGRLVER